MTLNRPATMIEVERQSMELNRLDGCAYRQSYLAPEVQSLQKRWPDNAVFNIVCHGHSVPAGYFATPLVSTFDSYPHLLHVLLKQRFPWAVINVIVSAIGGEASPGGADRFEQDVLGHRPNVVMIDYAINDRGCGLEKADVAWSGMIQAAQAQGVKVLLLTPTPINCMGLDAPAAKRAEIFAHAQQVRQLAARHQVGLVDVTALFEPLLGRVYDYLSEPNHPNRAGHEIVADELLRFFPIETQPK